MHHAAEGFVADCTTPSHCEPIVRQFDHMGNGLGPGRGPAFAKSSPTIIAPRGQPRSWLRHPHLLENDFGPPVEPFAGAQHLQPAKWSGPPVEAGSQRHACRNGSKFAPSGGTRRANLPNLTCGEVSLVDINMKVDKDYRRARLTETYCPPAKWHPSCLEWCRGAPVRRRNVRWELVL
jgi:hypothetical protein